MLLFSQVKGVLSGGMAVYLEAGLPTESRSRVDLVSIIKDECITMKC